MHKLTLHAIAKVLDILQKPFLTNEEEDPSNRVLFEFADIVNAMPDAKILEVGSRNVTGETHKRRNCFHNQAGYTGFDVLAGENVDIVGDAHELSSYFSANSYDAVMASSVFEHLLMPWKVVLEMNIVLKKGGYLYISVPSIWPPHELPCDFWRYLPNSFDGLLNKYTGFKILKTIEGVPCRVVSLAGDKGTRNHILYKQNQHVALIAQKIGDPDQNLKWDVKLQDITSCAYPH
ncbi:MAG: methyltransferase domain-containing protein [Elusimicrobiales bacterium]